MVGNEDRLSCNSVCPSIPIQLGNTYFFIDFYVLPINDTEMVLGIQWLKTLGRIIAVYSTFTNHHSQDTNL